MASPQITINQNSEIVDHESDKANLKTICQPSLLFPNFAKVHPTSLCDFLEF
jgi:hypothetical protein